MKQPLTIAFGVDNNFALPLAATIHSVLDGLPEQERPDLYIVSQDITDTNKERLHRVVGHRAQLHWLALPQHLVDPDYLTMPAYLSLATFYKVFLPELLPLDCHRVIYLDADVIVQGDLRELWKTDLQGNILMAVRDTGVFNAASPLGIRTYQKLNIPSEAPYFNGGVLLIDIVKWRQEEVTQRFLKYSKQYGKFALFGDQDGLNVVLHRRWGSLDAQWNIQTNIVDGRKIPGPPDRATYIAGLRERQDQLTASSFIIHYTERRKPWHPGFNHPFKSLFHDHFRQSKCFQSSIRYGVWYVSQYLAWAQTKLKQKMRRTWKKIKKRGHPRS